MRTMQFSIPCDHPSLPGHFPGRPIVPGVLLLERVLAAIAAHAPATAAAGPWRLPQVKFVRPLLPGQVARIELDAGAGGGWRFRVLRGDTLLASGEVRA